MKRTTHIIIFAIALFAFMASAHAQSPREQLNQMVEQLQKTPTDNALREKIIKLTREVKPAPAVPEEARRPLVRGNAVMSDAKGADEYARASKLYEEAILIAPWWGDPYFNLAKAQELKQDYEGAIQSLKFFLLSGSVGNDARQAQDHIYALEEKRDRQAEALRAITRAKVEESEKKARAKNISDTLNRWYAGKHEHEMNICYAQVVIGSSGGEKGVCNYEEYNGNHWQRFILGEPRPVRFEADDKGAIMMFDGFSTPTAVGSVPSDGSDDPNRVKWVNGYDNKAAVSLRFSSNGNQIWEVEGDTWVEDPAYDRSKRRTIQSHMLR